MVKVAVFTSKRKHQLVEDESKSIFKIFLWFTTSVSTNTLFTKKTPPVDQYSPLISSNLYY